MFVDRCVFQDGAHVYAGPDCPHLDREDEMGPLYPPGWTVQQG